MSMETHYDKNYYFADRYGGKKYLDSAGQPKTFGYYAGGRWNFEGVLLKLVQLLGYPQSVLDLGSGCGGFPAVCNMNHIESVGLEFSKYAIDNAILRSKKFLKCWDLAKTPWPVTHMYEWATAIDLFEHLFEEDVDAIIKETKRCAERWIIAKICTAQDPPGYPDNISKSREVWAAKKASYKEVVAQAKREGFEWLVVSGHVNSQFPQYWINKFVDDEWKLREDLSDKFKGDLKLPEDWRTTLILENEKWYTKEFMQTPKKERQ